MKYGFGKNLGFSFSWKRLIGITGMRTAFARRTGIPTTRNGVYNKIGRLLLSFLFNKTK
jgi:hypothetical protein